MISVVLDARLIGFFGIGTYLKNIIPHLKDYFRLALIVNPKILSSESWLGGYDLIFCKDPVYSVSEQLRLPFLIPSFDLFWSPHYNIPILPIRAKKRLVTIHDVFHLAYFINK